MAPSSPLNLRQLKVTTTTVTLGLDEPSDNGGADVFGYSVDYGQGNILEFMKGKCFMY